MYFGTITIGFFSVSLVDVWGKSIDTKPYTYVYK